MEHQLTRRILPVSLFMFSVNGIIGSGWLFAALYAAKTAGPAAIVSWIIGGAAAILIAITFAELSTLFPVAGGTAKIPHLSHGIFASFILSWIAWLSSLILPPIEVQAVLQYASLFFPSLTHINNGVSSLTPWGFMWATLLMVLLCLVNIMSYKGLARSNLIIFIFKVTVVLLTIIVILNASFHPGNFSGFVTATTSSNGWQMILGAVATSGIILSFNGFKSGVELAGEAKNLAVAIPLSTVGSVVACLIIYLGLQICFIGALDPASIASGWSNLKFSGDVAPFVGLAGMLGLFWLVKLLCVNAVVSPLGAGLIYVTSTARILYAMSHMGYVPKFFSKLNKQHLPVYAIIVNFLLGMLAFLPLPGWQAMVNFLGSALVITYAMGPIALISLRYVLPDQHRPFRLPAANFLCLLAFYCCNLFSYWTGWDTISKLGIALAVGALLFSISCLRGRITINAEEWKSARWILPYLIGLILISYLGAFGGKNIIPFGWDFLVIGILTIAVLYLAVQNRIQSSEEELRKHLYSEA